MKRGAGGREKWICRGKEKRHWTHGDWPCLGEASGYPSHAAEGQQFSPQPCPVPTGKAGSAERNPVREWDDAKQFWVFFSLVFNTPLLLLRWRFEEPVHGTSMESPASAAPVGLMGSSWKAGGSQVRGKTSLARAWSASFHSLQETWRRRQSSASEICNPELITEEQGPAWSFTRDRWDLHEQPRSH